MDKQMFIAQCIERYKTSESVYIPKDKALADDLASVRMFDAPIIGVADAYDVKFERMKDDHVIGKHYMAPVEWLPTAQSVISFFFPFTAAIRDGNKADMRFPSDGWLNGRIEGQSFINKYTADIVDCLTELSYKSVAPSLDERFFSQWGEDKKGVRKLYTSNWSERHAAYACGIGTFGLSGGLITEKGVAGRFTSVITQLRLAPDCNRFERYDENCVMCGACVRHCPAGAISFERGKDHAACSSFLNAVMAERAPWYGCGKCQVGVPCEYMNPHKKRSG